MRVLGDRKSNPVEEYQQSFICEIINCGVTILPGMSAVSKPSYNCGVTIPLIDCGVTILPFPSREENAPCLVVPLHSIPLIDSCVLICGQ
jgi:hypothetical protein